MDKSLVSFFLTHSVLLILLDIVIQLACVCLQLFAAKVLLTMLRKLHQKQHSR